MGDVPSADLAAWPGHLIFGLYFAVLTLSLQALHRTWVEGAPARQLLPPLMLACLCADLVFVNVQELYRTVDASYGLVAIWDMSTFFLWLRALELSSGPEQKFAASDVVAIVPVMALGREILFLPYSGLAERAYLDLVFGNSFLCAWTLAMALDDGRRARVVRFLLTVTICGSFYWVANAVENLLFLAWPPLPKQLYAAADSIGVKVFVLSLVYALVAAGVTLLLPAIAPRFAARLGLADERALVDDQARG